MRDFLINIMINYMKWLPDKLYLKIYYRLKTKKRLNLKNPKSYNEKINWLKLYYRNEEMTLSADKIEVRKKIYSLFGDKYLVPILWTGNDPVDIPYSKLPNKFVIKTNHASGTNIIVTDKSKLDREDVTNKLNLWLKTNYFFPKREWAYKNINRRILIEEYINQLDSDELRDYRIFCFNGVPKIVTVDFSITDKKKVRRNVYDLDWNLLPVQLSYPNETKIKLEKPANFEEMLEVSRVLSKPFPHVRIDLYNINGKILFGEMTFYHQSGMAVFVPNDFDITLGSYLQIK